MLSCPPPFRARSTSTPGASKKADSCKSSASSASGTMLVNPSVQSSKRSPGTTSQRLYSGTILAETPRARVIRFFCGCRAACSRVICPAAAPWNDPASAGGLLRHATGTRGNPLRVQYAPGCRAVKHIPPWCPYRALRDQRSLFHIQRGWHYQMRAS